MAADDHRVVRRRRGGATHTGTNSDAYGVFDGGGYETTTYVNARTWPTLPANPNCSPSDR